MSDDDRDLDLDSDDEGSGGLSNLPPGQDKRAHHNALERKRRDHIKDSFTGLKDAIPTLQVRMVYTYRVLIAAASVFAGGQVE